MPSPSSSRIHVTAGLSMVGVVIAIGDVQTAITLPAPNGGAQLTEDQVRTAALRAARRALDVAREELDHELGAAT